VCGKRQVTVDPRTCGPPEAYDDKYILKHGADLAQNSGQLRVPLLNRSKTIIVKVQTPEPMPNFDGLGFNLLHEAGLAGRDELMVYNETRDVYLMISSKKCEQYAAIAKSVSDKGIVGRKAYFPARIAPGGKITINYLGTCVTLCVSCSVYVCTCVGMCVLHTHAHKRTQTYTYT